MEITKQSLKIYNGSLEDLLGKKNNIWLGVSISLKPYSEELATNYLKTISTYSKDKALVFIGDKIASINFQELEKINSEKAQIKAKELGNIFFEKYESLRATLSEEHQNKIEIIRWDDAWTQKQEEQYLILREEYLKNESFRLDVAQPIINYLKNKNRTINTQRLERMSEYVLKELPFLLDGVEYQKTEYKTLLYPTYKDTTLSNFVTQIQTSPTYFELKEKLNIKGNHTLIDAILPSEKQKRAERGNITKPFKAEISHDERKIWSF